jgi:hypothetical protein
MTEPQPCRLESCSNGETVVLWGDDPTIRISVDAVADGPPVVARTAPEAVPREEIERALSPGRNCRILSPPRVVLSKEHQVSLFPGKKERGAYEIPVAQVKWQCVSKRAALQILYDTLLVHAVPVFPSCDEGLTGCVWTRKQPPAEGLGHPASRGPDCGRRAHPRPRLSPGG